MDIMTAKTIGCWNCRLCDRETGLCYLNPENEPAKVAPTDFCSALKARPNPETPPED